MADIAEEQAAALRLVLVPAVGRYARRAHRAGDLAHIDAVEVLQRPPAERAETPVMAHPERGVLRAALAERRCHACELLLGHGERLLHVRVLAGFERRRGVARMAVVTRRDHGGIDGRV